MSVIGPQNHSHTTAANFLLEPVSADYEFTHHGSRVYTPYCDSVGLGLVPRTPTQDFLSLPVRIISSFMSNTGNRGAVSGKSPRFETLSAGETENSRCSSFAGLASVRE